MSKFKHRDRVWTVDGHRRGVVWKTDTDTVYNTVIFDDDVEQRPSVYLDSELELVEPARAFAVGDEVTSIDYPVHGVGRVTHIRDVHTEIRVEFGNGVYLWTSEDKLLRAEPEVSYVVVKVDRSAVGPVRRVLHELSGVRSDQVFPSRVQRAEDSETIARVFEQSMTRGKRRALRPFVKRYGLGYAIYTSTERDDDGGPLRISEYFNDRVDAYDARDAAYPREDYL